MIILSLLTKLAPNRFTPETSDVLINSNAVVQKLTLNTVFQAYQLHQLLSKSRLLTWLINTIKIKSLLLCIYQLKEREKPVPQHSTQNCTLKERNHRMGCCRTCEYHIMGQSRCWDLRRCSIHNNQYFIEHLCQDHCGECWDRNICFKSWETTSQYVMVSYL